MYPYEQPCGHEERGRAWEPEPLELPLSIPPGNSRRRDDSDDDDEREQDSTERRGTSVIIIDLV